MGAVRGGATAHGAFRIVLAATLIAVALSLRLLGTRRTLRLLWWIADRLGSGPPPDPPAAARGWSRSIAAVAERLPLPVLCLPRAAVLGMLMRRRGIAGDLRIGVRAGGAFAAHAWVECGGTSLPGDEATDDCRRLWTVPVLGRVPAGALRARVGAVTVASADSDQRDRTDA